MRKSRFTEEQIIGLLKQADAGTPVPTTWATPDGMRATLGNLFKGCMRG